jgi:hypothetical protein
VARDAEREVVMRDWMWWTLGAAGLGLGLYFVGRKQDTVQQLPMQPLTSPETTPTSLAI